MMNIITKLKLIFSSSERIKLTVLIILLFIGMILEIFGLGALIPMLSFLLESESIEKSEFIQNIKNYLPEISNKGFVYLSLGSIVLLYLFKSLYVMYLTYRQNKFLANLSSSIYQINYLIFI